MLLVLAGILWGPHDNGRSFGVLPSRPPLGSLALFLFGIFYRLNPTVETSRLALRENGVKIDSIEAMGVAPL
jgi:hypothetical protein